MISILKDFRKMNTKSVKQNATIEKSVNET